MSNLEKLSSADLIAPGSKLSADEITALESMSKLELDTLLSARVRVQEEQEEPRIPTFHVVA
jgi:hypothetical protein